MSLLVGVVVCNSLLVFTKRLRIIRSLKLLPARSPDASCAALIRYDSTETAKLTKDCVLCMPLPNNASAAGSLWPGLTEENKIAVTVSNVVFVFLTGPQGHREP